MVYRFYKIIINAEQINNYTPKTNNTQKEPSLKEKKKFSRSLYDKKQKSNKKGLKTYELLNEVCLLLL